MADTGEGWRWELATPAGRADALAALYAGYLGRAPDPEGLQFWMAELDHGMAAGRDGLTVLHGIADSFARSPEAAETRGFPGAAVTGDGAAAGGFLGDLFDSLFDRTPTHWESARWESRLGTGLDPAGTVLDLVRDARGDDAAVLGHTVAAGRYYAQQVAARDAAFTHATAREAVARASVSEQSLVDARSFVDRQLGGDDDDADEGGTARPDLVAAGTVTSGDDALTPGSEAVLTVTSRNRGDGASERSHTLTYYLSEDPDLDSADRELGTARSGPLAPGGSEELRFTFELPATIGTQRQFVLIESDSADAIAESDETNNRQPVAFTPTSLPRPDLIAEAWVAEAARGPVGAGSEVTLDLRVTNRGDADAQERADLRVWFSDDRRVDAFDDIELDADRIAALDPGEAATERLDVGIPDDLVPDRYFILVETDTGRDVGESNESNNVTAAPVDVVVSGRPKPDLISAAAIVTEPGAIAAGAEIEVAVTTRNAGNAETDGRFEVAFYLSDDARLDAGDLRLDDEGTGPLEPGERDDADADFDLPEDVAVPGRFLLVVTDADGEVREADEGNNVAALDLASPGGGTPDLTPSLALAGDPDDGTVESEFVPGEAVPITGAVNNRGDAAAAAASTTRFYLSQDRQIDAGVDFVLGVRDQARLFAGETAPLDGDVFLPNTVAAGRYFLIAEADATDTLAESDETNNTAAVTLTVETDGFVFG